ncbi:hypothetical protein M5D96_005950 [Drosophila gunungcola]|uniref:Uncharacterized protein n=1 Tax=Drosophila gunungcola TaxID=103775 RepID=A0A9P9YRQ9_9MUSC|nr:hypothetical protein M5D96_005950 [Drosophila gunungcola]
MSGPGPEPEVDVTRTGGLEKHEKFKQAGEDEHPALGSGSVRSVFSLD